MVLYLDRKKLNIGQEKSVKLKTFINLWILLYGRGWPFSYLLLI